MDHPEPIANPDTPTERACLAKAVGVAGGFKLDTKSSEIDVGVLEEQQKLQKSSCSQSAQPADEHHCLH